MADPRAEAVAGVVARVEGAACRLARLATRAAVVGAAAGAVLWWFVAGDRIGDWWQGSLASVLVLALCLAPALWLVNVRTVLADLVGLPDRLRGVATRRGAALRAGSRTPAPRGGVLGTVRAIRAVVRDYGDLVGSWGTVAQLVAPSFWLLTVGALAVTPVLAVVAAAVALVRLAA